MEEKMPTKKKAPKRQKVARTDRNVTLYSYVSTLNKKWVQAQAKKYGLGQSVYMEQMIRAARTGKFQITTSTKRR